MFNGRTSQAVEDLSNYIRTIDAKIKKAYQHSNEISLRVSQIATKYAFIGTAIPQLYNTEIFDGIVFSRFRNELSKLKRWIDQDPDIVRKLNDDTKKILAALISGYLIMLEAESIKV